MTRKLWLCAVVFLGLAGQAAALDAVIRVKEDAYYTQYKSTRYVGASLTRFYAPLPVFFEGWPSSPRTDITDYAWDFGDGSPGFHGFNAAHVYETPGVYYAKLTVTDKYGHTNTEQLRVEALAPNGKTYYVDAVAGQDTNTGLSPTAAWRTATYAFAGIARKQFKPGDRILFKRGQTFQMEAGKVNPYTFPGYGFSFGAFGTGAKPLIQKVGASTAPLINLAWPGPAHIALVDLEFRSTSPEGVASGEVFLSKTESFNLLLLRVDLKDCGRGFGFNGDYLKRRIHGVFIVDCTIHDSSHLALYVRASRFALLNSSIDMAENHLIYASFLDKAVFAGNALTRPPYGRAALRICGSSSYDYPTNNVLIQDNHIEGWIDPLNTGGVHNGGGTRYNYTLMDIGPNTQTKQAICDVEMRGNTVLNAEKLLTLGVVQRMDIHHNHFSTLDPNAHAHRITVGHAFELRPCRDVKIADNVIVSYEYRPRWASIIGVFNYTGPEYLGLTYHKNIQIYRNSIELTNSNGASIIWIKDARALQVNEVHSDNNSFYTPRDTDIFMVGGDYWSGPIISLSKWRELTGEDRNSKVAGLKLDAVALLGF